MDYDYYFFDMDGAVTNTRHIHYLAWVNAYKNFNIQITEDIYRKFIDGKNRVESIKTIFIKNKLNLDHVELLSSLKNKLFLDGIQRERELVYKDSIDYLNKLCEAGKKIALVTSSKNFNKINELTDISKYFDIVVDGIYGEENGLQGKPSPDYYRRAYELISSEKIDLNRCVGFEDSSSGLESLVMADFKNIYYINRFNSPVEFNNRNIISIDNFYEL